MKFHEAHVYVTDSLKREGIDFTLKDNEIRIIVERTYDKVYKMVIEANERTDKLIKQNQQLIEIIGKLDYAKKVTSKLNEQIMDKHCEINRLKIQLKNLNK